MTRRRPRGEQGRHSGVLRSAFLLGLGVLMLSAGAMLVVSRASAVWQDVGETGLPGYLLLRSDPGVPEWQDVGPGDDVHWFIEARLEDSESSSLSLQLRSSGELTTLGGMHVSVASCTTPFSGGSLPSELPSCGGSEETVISYRPITEVSSPSSGQQFELARLSQESPRYLFVRLGFPAESDPDSISNAMARIGVGLFAVGDDGSPDRPGSAPPGSVLTHTGADYAAVGIIVIGAWIVVIGAVLLRRSARPTTQPEQHSRAGDSA